MTFTGYEVELALKLEKRYGSEKVCWDGCLPNIANLREHQRLSYSKLFSEFIEKYGDFSVSQLQCLNCRTSMYRVAIVYALQNDIKYIAEGVRKEQLFALEQDSMRRKYEELCEKFGIELLWPVWNKTDDEIRVYHSKICLGVPPEFLYPNQNGFITGESKCLCGMPVVSRNVMEDEQTLFQRIRTEDETAAKYYEQVLEPHINKHLLDHKQVPLIPAREGGPFQFKNIGHDSTSFIQSNLTINNFGVTNKDYGGRPLRSKNGLVRSRRSHYQKRGQTIK